MATLGGNVCIRNGFRLDYCWQEAVKSLLPICDEVVICDCDSDDGTRERIDAWSREEPKITIVNFPWTNPIRTNQWWPEWLNYARQHLSTDMHIQLDADEVLHEDDYDLIQQARDSGSVLYCKRLNFWTDPFHLVPEGVHCGSKVIKLAPKNLAIPSDYPYEPAAEAMSKAVESNVRIFHYGFIRKREQFFIKAKEVHRIWSGAMDERLSRAEKYEGEWSKMPGVTGWEDRVTEYAGSHPEIIKDWLRERNYAIS